MNIVERVITFDREQMIASVSTWNYDDRRTCQEIFSRVWLGPYTVGKDYELLKELHVTDIILVRSNEGIEKTVLKERNQLIQYHTIEMNDSRVECPIKIFAYFSDLVTNIRNTDDNRCILVLGLTGMNRSSALLAAFLIKTQSLTAIQSLDYLVSRRRCVSVSETLKRQLSEFEIFAKQFKNSLSPRSKRNRS